MLPSHLRDILITWINKTLYGSNAGFNPYHSKIVPGEIIISVKREVTLKYSGISIPVIIKKHFQTTTLSNDPLSENPKADMYRLEIFLKQVDNDFISEVTEAENEIIERMNPDESLE